MKISRRNILKGILLTAAGGSVLKATEELVLALSEKRNGSPLFWINENGNRNNLLAQLGSLNPSFLELIVNRWDLYEYGPLLPTGYKPSKDDYSSSPILIMESFPHGMKEWGVLEEKLSGILEKAKAAILLGTEACYGGLHNSAENVSRFEKLCKREKTPLIKLPGIPVPPHHLVGILSHLEYFGFPRLDSLRRPVLYYGETVCGNCEYRDDFETGRFADWFGEDGCLFNLGCKGPNTRNSCSVTRWNGGENWCVGVGGPCTGCSEPGFPDHGGLGLYGGLGSRDLQNSSPVLRHIEGLGWGLLGLTGIGIGLNLLRRSKENPKEKGERGGMTE